MTAAAAGRCTAAAVLAAAAVLVAGHGSGFPQGASGATVTGPPSSPAPVALTDAQLAGQRVVRPLPAGPPPAALLAAIRRGEVGAVILFARNIPSTAAARALVARLQAVPRPAALDAPLLVMVDQEGGLVKRIPDAALTSAADLGRSGDPRRARVAGRRAGDDLRRIGANVDLAPVADVGRPGGAIASQSRSFSSDPGATSAFAVAFARGLRDRGVAAAAKHFPGLGGAAETTDAGAVRVGLSRRALRRADAAPFSALVRDGIPAVMVASAVYPALDPRPAMLSARVIRGELRNRLGFRGVVVSDALDAPGARAAGPAARTAVSAARAGVDLLLYAGSEGAAQSAAGALRRALASGELDRDAARDAVRRVTDLRKAVARQAVR